MVKVITAAIATPTKLKALADVNGKMAGRAVRLQPRGPKEKYPTVLPAFDTDTDLTKAEWTVIRSINLQ